MSTNPNCHGLYWLEKDFDLSSALSHVFGLDEPLVGFLSSIMKWIPLEWMCSSLSGLFSYSCVSVSAITEVTPGCTKSLVGKGQHVCQALSYWHVMSCPRPNARSALRWPCYVLRWTTSITIGTKWFLYNNVSRITTGTVSEQGSVWLHRYLLYFRVLRLVTLYRTEKLTISEIHYEYEQNVAFLVIIKFRSIRLYAGSNYCQSHMFLWTHEC